MDFRSKQHLKLRKMLFAVLVALILLSLVLAGRRRTEWIIPAEAAARTNPVPVTAEGLQNARAIYKENCARCHGDKGKGDGSDAWLNNPSDLTAAHTIKSTDGALFYQISEGRKPMPAFKTRLTEQERWHLVNFLRTLSAK